MNRNDNTIDLLSTVEYGGCSAKIPASILEKVLVDLPKVSDPNILVDIETHDDAGVYKLNDELALIVTTDFFPPICSDPFTFGEIAATNSISDVYAMGGEPFLALNIAMFPSKSLPIEAYAQILNGAAETARRAKTLILGGHTIDDNPPKFGLAVVGKVHPNKVITNAGLKPNQLLILTKPIGTGVIVAAQRMQLASEKAYNEALFWMKTLNDTGALVMQKYGVTGGTDITGFGLLGHSLKMARASKVDIELYSSKIPLLEDAYSLVNEGCIPGAAFRNLEYTNEGLRMFSINYNRKLLMADAQTSGGLLFGVDPDKVDQVIAELHSLGLLRASVVGSVKATGSGSIDLY